MNHAKLDAALALALEEAGDEQGLVVFVDLEEGAVGVEEGLARVGLDPGAPGGPGRGVRTATLSARQVVELSEEPWVRRVRLSQRLGLSEER